MKTIILNQPGELQLIDTALPGVPDADQAQVRVRAVGICGTDLHAYHGDQPFFSYPRILGHELAVEIVALGSTSQPHHLSVGDVCAINPYLNCGQCIACRRGKPNCCVHMRVLGVHIDGGMREVINVPIAKLHKSERLPDNYLAITEMLAVTAHAVDRTAIEPDENVLIIGAGPIGVGVISFVQAAGGRPIIAEVSPFRQQFCRSVLSQDRLVDAKGDVVEQLQTMLGGDLPTVVIDATGNARSMANALSYMAHGGKLTFVGLFQGEIAFNDPQLHAKETTLLRTRNALDKDFRRVISMLESGALDPALWLTHRTTPERIVADFPGWLNPANNVMKAVLEF
jgi:2-desacetyl-2-hydroxyethyl bacteriochlorophyllide A dehydrogenase